MTPELKLGIYSLHSQDQSVTYVATSLGNAVDGFIAELPEIQRKITLGLEIIVDSRPVEFTAEALDALAKMYPAIKEPQTQVNVPRPITREGENTSPSLRSGSFESVHPKK